MNKIELAVAAGLMEGEGSVRLDSITKRNNGALIVALTNTNFELVHWMQARWPGYCKLVSGLRADQKPAMCWVIAANRALAFLTSIEPFVISWRMRERIKTARWWQEIKSKHWRLRNDG